jgi:hypothetical protein
MTILDITKQELYTFLLVSAVVALGKNLNAEIDEVTETCYRMAQLSIETIDKLIEDDKPLHNLDEII